MGDTPTSGGVSDFVVPTGQVWEALAGQAVRWHFCDIAWSARDHKIQPPSRWQMFMLIDYVFGIGSMLVFEV